MKVVLIGNPNTGKSTLINALTGACEKTGNWPGVTVEKKTGIFFHEGMRIEITDLPGIYSLDTPSESTSLDEKIATTYLAQSPIDLIINLVDASKIEHHLYLSSQLIDLGIPMILVLNKMDLAKKLSIALDEQALERIFDCPVLSLEAHQKKGIASLKNKMIEVIQQSTTPSSKVLFPPCIEEAILELTAAHTHTPSQLKRIAAIHLLTSSNESAHIKMLQKKIEETLGAEADIMIASSRYDFAHQTAQHISSQASSALTFNVTEALDKVLLNRFLGIPLFLAILYSFFFFSIHVGKVFQNFFEVMGEALFVNGTAHLLQALKMPNWLMAILSHGIGKGINTTLSFIPVLTAMFLSLSFLEMSGYMARAAFIMDRIMKCIGLSGKSFIPLIIGFGCNVPSIMATRTLSNENDRILTVMMAPFMSCSARLAIYSIFVATFFPTHGANVIFLLYVIGILTALLTAWLFKSKLDHQPAEHHTIEIPPYHFPSFITLLSLTWHRLKNFIVRAGAVIVPISATIYILNAVSLDGHISFGGWQQDSILAFLGKKITPLFGPMGIQQDNWPASVGLLSGVLAKEVVIGTLNTLYSQTSTLIDSTLPMLDLWKSLQEAGSTIPENLSKLKEAFIHPFSLSDENLTSQAQGVMFMRFGGKISAFAYLLFTLLYIPCMSTFAAIAKELNWKWSMTSILWSTGLAYSTAVLFYQIATMPLHFMTSLFWVFVILVLLGATLIFITPPAKTFSL